MIRYILFMLLVTSAAFANLQIYPQNAQMKSGTFIQFTVVTTDRSGNNYTPNDVRWSATYGNVNKGYYTAPSQAGNYSITARWGRYTATANVRVKAQYSISKIVITPQNQRVEINRGVYFKAVAYDNYGRVTPLKSPKWWADGGNIDPSGYYRAGYRPGRYTVWVQDTYSGIKSSASIEIYRQTPQLPRLHHIAITPRNQKVNIGGNLQLKAIGYDQYNRVVAFTPKWSCNGGSIDPRGYYRAPNRPGYYNIWVEDNYGTKASTSIEVIRSSFPTNPGNGNGGRVFKIVITPRNQRVAIGKGIQLKAIAYDRYDRVVNFRGRWWCDGGNVNNGYYQAGYKTGTYTVWVEDTRSRVKASTNITIIRNSVPPYNPPHGGGKARIDIVSWDVDRGNLFHRSRIKVRFTVHGRKVQKAALFGIYPTGKVVEIESASCSNGQELFFKEKYSYNITRLEIRLYDSWDQVIAKYSASGR